jgi:hypothetical protein
MKDGIYLAIAIVCFLIIIFSCASTMHKPKKPDQGNTTPASITTLASPASPAPLAPPASPNQSGVSGVSGVSGIQLTASDVATVDEKPQSTYLIPRDTSVPTSMPIVGQADLWTSLSPDEKMDYLVQRYFEYDTGSADDTKTTEENKYISSLPQSDSCSDDYDDCPAWASAGECDINPEFMLYHCQSSCKSCALTLQQKQNVTAILNTRQPPSCVYHGAEYPGPTPYNQKVLTYYNA